MRIELIGLRVDKEFKAGDDIAKAIVEAAESNGVSITDGDVIVVTHKVVSKAEGRVVDLRNVTPSKKAVEIAEKLGKDPRLVEVILRESSEILKCESGHLITMTRHGIVCANSGVDQSNSGGGEKVILLPTNPDDSARRIREGIEKLTGARVAVVITDTQGRPFREGVVNVAIGFSGINPFKDYRGVRDRCGYELNITIVNVVDEIAAAAELLMGQASESIPFVIVRGLSYEYSLNYGLKDILMERSKWLFK